MNICKQCGVELEDDMKSCPLCDAQLSSGEVLLSNIQDQLPREGTKKHLMQRILWQITVVLLMSGVVATLLINMSLVGRITWSIYPISICLIILAYVSLLAMWRTAIIFQLLAGWLISALILLLVNWYSQEDWPILLGLPVLCAINIIGIVLYILLIRLKTKGLNVLALIFVSLAVSSLAIEAIISMYFNGKIALGWSVIVSACLLPVTATLLFMYFRTRNNPDLQKIFHT